MTQLFETVAHGNRFDRAVALGSLLQKARTMTQILSRDAALKPRAEALLRTTVDSACRVHAAMDADPHAVTTLFELNWLKAALLQSDGAVVGGDSYLTLFAERRERQSMRQSRIPALPPGENSPQQEYMLSYNRLGRVALRTSVADAWREFSSAIAASPDAPANQRLAGLVLKLQELDISAIWLNSVFIDTWNTCEGEPAVRAEKCLAALEAEARDSANTAAIAWTKSSAQRSDVWRGRLYEWSDPAAFTTLFAEFEKDLVARLQEGAERYAKSGASGKLALLTWFGQAVDVYDQTIKSVTGTPDYPDKPQRFLTLLQPYAQLMKAWIDIVPDLKGQNAGYGNSSKTVQKIIEILAKKGLTGVNTSDLTMSPTFNVASAKLGSGTEFSQHKPKTLEDCFTLIHQNLLVIQGAAMGGLAFSAERLPESLQDVVTQLTDMQLGLPAGYKLTGNLVSMTYQHPALRVELNVPMREHSIKINITQDRGAPDRAQVQVNYFSEEDEHERMERAMLLSAIFAHALQTPFVPSLAPNFDKGKRMASWTWDVHLTNTAGKQFAETLPKLLHNIGITSFHREDLTTILNRMAEHVPNLQNKLRDLPTQFFAQYPWYNFEFLDSRVPGGPYRRALPALIGGTKGQDLVWLNTETWINSPPPFEVGAKFLIHDLQTEAGAALLRQQLTQTERLRMAEAMEQRGQTLSATLLRNLGLSDASTKQTTGSIIGRFSRLLQTIKLKQEPRTHAAAPITSRTKIEGSSVSRTSATDGNRQLLTTFKRSTASGGKSSFSLKKLKSHANLHAFATRKNKSPRD